MLQDIPTFDEVFPLPATLYESTPESPFDEIHGSAENLNREIKNIIHGPDYHTESPHTPTFNNSAN